MAIINTEVSSQEDLLESRLMQLSDGTYIAVSRGVTEIEDEVGLIPWNFLELSATKPSESEFTTKFYPSQFGDDDGSFMAMDFTVKDDVVFGIIGVDFNGKNLLMINSWETRGKDQEFFLVKDDGFNSGGFSEIDKINTSVNEKEKTVNILIHGVREGETDSGVFLVKYFFDSIPSPDVEGAYVYTSHVGEIIKVDGVNSSDETRIISYGEDVVEVFYSEDGDITRKKFVGESLVSTITIHAQGPIEDFDVVLSGDSYVIVYLSQNSIYSLVVDEGLTVVNSGLVEGGSEVNELRSPKLALENSGTVYVTIEVVASDDELTYVKRYFLAHPNGKWEGDNSVVMGKLVTVLNYTSGVYKFPPILVGSDSSTILFAETDENAYTIPGPDSPYAGDYTAGYFGNVNKSLIFSATELAKEVGLTEGALIPEINDSPLWFKMAVDGKILFVPNSALYHSVSWEHLNELGLVDGSKTVTINRLRYKVRLFEGLKVGNPKGSEWNRLIPPMTERASTGNWNYPDNIESNLPNWNIGFTDEDLGFETEYGRQSICQEVIDGKAILRGGVDASYSGEIAVDATWGGWRPVLEFITDQPYISGEDEYYGSVSEGFDYNFEIGPSVTGAPIEQLMVSVLIPGGTNHTLISEDFPKGTSYTARITDEIVAEMPRFTECYISILVEDIVGVFSIRTISFSKGKIVQELPEDTPLLDVVQAVADIPPYLAAVRGMLGEAITEKGGSVSDEPTFTELEAGIREIPEGKGYWEGEVTSSTVNRSYNNFSGSLASFYYVSLSFDRIGFIPSKVILHESEFYNNGSFTTTLWFNENYLANPSGTYYANCAVGSTYIRVPTITGGVPIPVGARNRLYKVFAYE